MRPLHLRMLAADPDRADIAALIAELRASGHFVTTSDTEKAPAGVSKSPDVVLTDGANPASESLAEAEARHIAAVLYFTGGNKRQSAIILGVARSTLLAKIRRYGLPE